jgi:hypothetical protein
MGLRAVLEAHEHRDLGAERATVELDRFLAAAIEEQVGLDLHGVSFSGSGVIIAHSVTVSRLYTTIIVVGKY